jgi:hypothetical protein
VSALDAIDRAWGQITPSPRSEGINMIPSELPQRTTAGDRASGGALFITGVHGRLRHEAIACAHAWTAWLDAPHTPKEGPRHRPRDARRDLLGLEVLWALQAAGIPLTLSRKSDPVQDVLRIMLHAAGARAGHDLYRTARTWLQRVRAVDQMIEVTRRR